MFYLCKTGQLDNIAFRNTSFVVYHLISLYPVSFLVGRIESDQRYSHGHPSGQLSVACVQQQKPILKHHRLVIDS